MNKDIKTKIDVKNLNLFVKYTQEVLEYLLHLLLLKLIYFYLQALFYFISSSLISSIFLFSSFPNGENLIDNILKIKNIKITNNKNTISK